MRKRRFSPFQEQLAVSRVGPVPYPSQSSRLRLFVHSPRISAATRTLLRVRRVTIVAHAQGVFTFLTRFRRKRVLTRATYLLKAPPAPESEWAPTATLDRDRLNSQGSSSSRALDYPTSEGATRRERPLFSDQIFFNHTWTCAWQLARRHPPLLAESISFFARLMQLPSTSKSKSIAKAKTPLTAGAPEPSNPTA